VVMHCVFCNLKTVLYIIYMSLVFQGMEPFNCVKKLDGMPLCNVARTRLFQVENKSRTYSTLCRFIVVFTPEDMFIRALIGEMLPEID
jgi:hypothetical protein